MTTPSNASSGQVCSTVAELRGALTAHRGAGDVIGLVPTMGALHEGHLSLIRLAAAECDVVVVSIFINPRQFNDASDLAGYPRDPVADAQLAIGAGAAIIFQPDEQEMYPAGFASTISISGISETLEGQHRGASHFDGVATVVGKLLIQVAPDVAYFGQKDAQQVAVVRRLVADLDLPVRIATGATVRDPDGLAMSSRNGRLDPRDRWQALALRAALDEIQRGWDSGIRDPDALVDAGLKAMRDRDVEPEYLALVDPDSFLPVPSPLRTAALAVVAAQVGQVRLIDNQILAASGARVMVTDT